MNHVFAGPVGPNESRTSAGAYVYALSAAIGGLGLGTVLVGLIVAVELLPTGVTIPTAAALAFAATALQAFGRMAFLPERDVQVPSGWLRLGPIRAAAAFGLTLGFGLATRLKYPIVYAILAGLIVLGDPAVAVVAGLIFGLSRGLVPLALLRSNRLPERAAALESTLSGRSFDSMARLGLTLLSALILAGIVQLGSVA